jgi:hypothetical protein
MRSHPRLRNVVLAGALVVVGVLATDALGDLTQSRPDHVAPDSRSAIVLHVSGREYLQDLDDGARNLWAACAGTTSRRLVDDADAFTEVGTDAYRFVVQPALGRHTRRKLVGCLEDLTVDNLVGDVVSITSERD